MSPDSKKDKPIAERGNGVVDVNMMSWPPRIRANWNSGQGNYRTIEQDKTIHLKLEVRPTTAERTRPR